MCLKTLLVTTFCLFSTLALSQSSYPTWLRELTNQLEQEKGCEVTFYVRTHDEAGNGSGYVEARAQCKDGREFDAFRENPKQLFSVSECTYAVC